MGWTSVTAGMVAAFAVLVVAGPAPAQAQDAAASAAACTKLAGSLNDVGLTEGGVAFDAIDPALAIPACETAVADNPSDPRQAYQLGRALDKAKRFEEALARYHAAAEAGFPLAYVAIGASYEYGEGVEKDVGKAVDYYEKAAEAGDPRGMFDLGYAFEHGMGRARDLAEAERLYRGVLVEGRPFTAGFARNQLAYLFAKENVHLDEAELLARAAVEEAVSSGTDHPNRLDTLAYVLHRLGRNEEALGIQQKAIGLLDEEEAVYFARLGDICDALGRRDEARAAWQKALDLPVDETAFDSSYDLDALKAKLAG